MWTAVHIIEGEKTAIELKEKLIQEGFLIKLKLFVKDGDIENYQIMTPEFEANDVYNAIIDLGY
ncbi:hypothetical protein [Senegalia massiliensis]|uniref:Uncharacterized protein n=1 Tax=Senegalia massiliensis TaxID=1720316 RepID=A0A845R3K4_9CLOT|nr:hypothetical protein [Senegalia massiliensis]NBI08178.1 hypothetical protein [Senegalia massiliensis]